MRGFLDAKISESARVFVGDNLGECAGFRGRTGLKRESRTGWFAHQRVRLCGMGGGECLFQEGLVVVEHLFVEVDAVVATDIVLVVGIDEVVHLFAGLDTGIDELNAVLPDNGVVLGTMNDQ